MGFSPNLNHGHPGFDPAPDVGAHLSVSLRRLPKITPHLLVGSVQRSLLLTTGSPRCTAAEGFLPTQWMTMTHCYLIIQLLVTRTQHTPLFVFMYPSKARLGVHFLKIGGLNDILAEQKICVWVFRSLTHLSMGGIHTPLPLENLRWDRAHK